MRKFTDEELKLAPEVAGVMGLGTDPIRTLLAINDKGEADHSWNGEVPLPLEYDCLEWLREYNIDSGAGIITVHTGDPLDVVTAPTILEALYRVILLSGKEGE